jgi:hypothetical protein
MDQKVEIKMGGVIFTIFFQKKFFYKTLIFLSKQFRL